MNKLLTIALAFSFSNYLDAQNSKPNKVKLTKREMARKNRLAQKRGLDRLPASSKPESPSKRMGSRSVRSNRVQNLQSHSSQVSSNNSLKYFATLQGSWWRESIDLDKEIKIAGSVLTYNYDFYGAKIGAGAEMDMSSLILGTEAYALVGMGTVTASVDSVSVGSSRLVFGFGATPYAMYNFGEDREGQLGLGLGVPLIFRFAPGYNTSSKVIENSLDFAYSGDLIARYALSSQLKIKTNLGYFNFKKFAAGLGADYFF